MDTRRLTATLAAAVVVSLSGIGAGTALAATPAPPTTTVHPTPPPVTPVTPVHPLTPSQGGGIHHAATSTPGPDADGGSALPLVLGGLGIAVVAGGGAYALSRGGAADRERERRAAADVRVVTVRPVGHGYDQPRYDQPRYEQPRYGRPCYEQSRYR